MISSNPEDPVELRDLNNFSICGFSRKFTPLLLMYKQMTKL